MNFKIFVTGCTGWVGKSFLNELQSQIPREKFNEKVICFSSKKKNLLSTNYFDPITIPCYPLEEMPKLSRREDELRIFHSAFVTKEKIKKLGLYKYINANKKITNLVENSIQNAKKTKSVIISSGAASIYDHKEYKYLDHNLDPYGTLKYKEEKILSKFSNFLVLRIYALTGRFIRDPHVFALGDFIKCALEKRSIEILSRNNIIRGYGFAGDISKLAYNWLISNDNSFKNPISTVTHTISLRDLAKLISEMYELPNLKDQINVNLVENIYTDSSDNYLKILKHYGIKPTDLRQQIADTYKGLLSQS